MLINNFPLRDDYLSFAKNFNVIPVCREILADTETPVSLLKKFYNGKDSVFLLESVEGGERWGRYSFLGTSARTDVRVFKDHVELRSKGGQQQKITHHGDPLGTLKAWPGSGRRS